MLAPAERPLPGWSEGSALRAAWRRTFSSMQPGPRRARIAHLAFDRRSPRGLVLWEQHVEIEATEHVHLKRDALVKRSTEILPSTSLPGVGSQSSYHEQYRCTTQFDLMRASGMGHEALASTHSDHRLSPASPEHHLDVGPSAGPGEVRIVQRAFHDDLAESTRTVLHLTLAIFEEEGPDERAWELFDWQEAVRADLLRVAADPATLASASAARELGVLALLFGKQSELPTLARLDVAAMALPEHPLPAFLPARAMLGDQAVSHENGVVERIDELYSGLPRLRYEGRWFWLRAFELGTQGNVGAQAYERWVARSWISRPDLAGHYFMYLAYLLVGVLLVVLTARRLLARRPVLLLAPLLVSFGLGLVCLRLGRGGADLAPDALGLALAGLGVYWLARRLPGRVSQVAPSLFALAFLAELLSCAAPSSWYANCFAGLCGLASLLGLPYLVAALYRSAQLSPRERSYLRPGARALLYYAGAGVLLYLMAIGARVSMDVVVMRAPRAMPLPIFTLFLCHLPLARALWSLDHAARCQFGLQRIRLPRERRGPEHALRAAGARR